MTELEQIAESVAKALGLKRGEFNKFWLDADARTLFYDGFNLFDPYWQVRCRDWLLERGNLAFRFLGTHNFIPASGDGLERFFITCPASEFCARAIHALDKQER